MKKQIKNFAETIKNDPKAIILWARKEIKLYEELIALLENKKPKQKYVAGLPYKCGDLPLLEKDCDNFLF